MQTSNTEMRNLRSLIHEKMQHTYIESYVDIPEINDDKLFLLKAILDDTDLTGLQKENYITTTMLVQMALDTHDLVPQTNNYVQTDSERKNKQLSVLAGDYYSGLYYLILSSIEEIELVHMLAAAIKEINECKMQLYYNKADSLHEFLTINNKIDSLLIMYVAEFVQEKEISNITGDWLLLSKLLEAKRNLAMNNASSVFTYRPGYSAFTEQLNNPEVINQIILDNVTSLKNSLDNFPSRLTSLKADLMDTLSEQLSSLRIISEEG
ncbi:heptaprenyl diphosphate synthase component 1 [Virgibacillus ihumii]|uniref:heptaprenyl diphosphate synthase component 1 n=1 Tax=Virgibacillus ihumii TaxID=2686091 RepID=UPI00157CD84E|nr:heptaprenyl diphosphate synthase component 1 [Virgibacillus ihumii]